jgi:rubrerythrin
MTFKEYLKESFVNIQDIKDDSDILRLAIQAELDAASLYNILSKKTSNPDIKKVLLDIKEEEHVHIGEFEVLLKDINPNYKNSKIEGKEEVDYLLDNG